MNRHQNELDFDIFSLDSSMLEEKDLANQLQIKLWEKLSRFQWLPFEEAREFVRALGLVSGSKWREYCNSGNKPNNIPSSPRFVYKDKWISMGDWLGTDTIAPQNMKFLSFKDARKIVRTLGIKTSRDWREYKLRPKNIPYKPQVKYKNNGWKGWPDFLGKE